ncbi:MAG: hypothetical protein AAGE94_08165 [Acidobacteriota bacterium]
MTTQAGPFTVGEQGEPGSLTAYADFTCPTCSEHTRFFARDQDADGGFTCPHCGLTVVIRGTRLSDYQAQLDVINADVRRFAAEARQKLARATHELLEKHEHHHEHPPAEPSGDPDSNHQEH